MNANSSSRPSPYQGLIPYSENDAPFFFGREKDTRLITANLFASPLTILYGPSGVGKSSILRAGVVFQLSQREDLTVIYLSDWKDDPLKRMKAKVASLIDNSMLDLHSDLPFSQFLEESINLLSTKGQVENKNKDDKSGHRLMIVLDQFEEYFLYHPDEDLGKDSFVNQFSRAVMQRGNPVHFLISIREDALAKLDRFEGRIPILFDNYLRLEHLDEEGARSAIEMPINKFNEMELQGGPSIEVEPALVNEVLLELKSEKLSLQQTGPGMTNSASSTVIETPYLQLVMQRLWDQEMKTGSHKLRSSTLTSLGGAEKIVKTHLDAVMKKLSISQRSLASRIFLHLVTPSGTKIALQADDLVKYAESSIPKVQALLQRLADPDIRLLRVVETNDKKVMSYEIFHDVLAAPILDWRSRRVRLLRYAWLGAIIAVIFLCIFSCVAVFYLLELEPENINMSDDLYYILITVLCLVPIISIPVAFGFFIGRGWGRNR